MPSPKHEKAKHAKHVADQADAMEAFQRSPITPSRPKAKRKVGAAALLAIALIIVVGVAVSVGPLADKHRRVGELPVDGAPFESAILKEAPSAFAHIDRNKPYNPSPAEIASLPAAEGVTAFSLNPNTKIQPVLSDDDEQLIEDALSYFTNSGRTCSCLIVDLGTGQGVGFSYDQRVYGASAFKGIVSAYVCEEKIDNGSYELGGSVQNLMKSTIEWSDNDAYRILKTGYAGNMVDWVTELGIDPTYVTRYRFPTYNAQESTALWAHVATYLDSGTETAVWLGETLTRTNVSHIREAVTRGLEEGMIEADGEVVVQNKAGWIAGSANSTTDAGLVRMNGHVYAISVMSNAPDCAASRDAATNVALALLVAMQ